MLGYYEKHYAVSLENLEEIDSLELCNFSKLKEEEVKKPKWTKHKLGN